jgi:transposase-like protein
MARRKRFGAEFKRQALRRANEPGMTDTLVCEEIGVTTRQLRRWRDAVKADKKNKEHIVRCEQVWLVGADRLCRL